MKARTIAAISFLTLFAGGALYLKMQQPPLTPNQIVDQDFQALKAVPPYDVPPRATFHAPQELENGYTWK